MSTRENVMRRTPRKLSDIDQQYIGAVKDAGADLWDLFDRIGMSGGHSRELEIAKQKVEESVMWATKHISAP